MTTPTNGATIEHHIGATGRFHLRQLSGEISVRGVDGDLVSVRERDGKSVSASFRVEATDGSLSLTAPDRFGLDALVFGIGRRSSLDLEVEVPRGADVSIETASGDVTASGLVGMTKVRTASGEVSLDALGGILELDAVSGDVSISAVAALDLRARTISGDCSLRAPSLGRAVIETTSGDIRLDANLAGRGPFEIHTVSGDATIVGRSGMQIEARTVTGDLRSDLPHRLETGPGRKRLIVGDGGVTLGFKSVSGDLRVSAPRDVLAPARPAVPVPAAPPPAPRPEFPPHVPTALEPPAPPAPPAPGYGRDGGQEVARLDVLMALERGDLSVEAAMQRLADIEEA
jgi:hypothetical protein